MKLFRSPRARVSDDQYIAKLRRSIELWDRWRYWLILLHVGLLAAAIWMFSNVIPMLMGIAQPANAPVALIGFITGAMLGWAFGWITLGILHGLIAALRGFRTERLLLEFYDAQSLQPFEDEDENEEAAEPTTEFRDLHERVDPF